ncbi:alpha/beta hydrolase family protein [Sphingomonas sp. HT-1]|uniref:alpha/beta hydrolase family protein n=1 Tax=unclassified Sphingomonas TaxID=196159 RepID=UPI00030A9845|nr:MULTISPECIES: S9 family peptidase [unclassified Sphingomonas]KTF67632.1 peptidase [Sphingomonas sp. WG]
MRKKWCLFAAAAVVAVGGAVAAVQAQDMVPAVAKPAQGKVDTAVFAELPVLESPELSPDGKRFAAQLAVRGTQYFAVATIDGTSKKLIGTGDADLNWWRWVNDEWLVIGVGRTTPVQGDEWYITRAIGVNANTGKIVALNTSDTAQNGGKLLWSAHDGTPRILLAAQTSIYTNDAGFWPRVDEVDVSTGKHKRVLEGREGVMDWYADASGTVRMGIGTSEDGRNRRLLYRPDGRGAFRVVDRAKGIHDSLLVPSLFLPDPGKALVVQDDEQGFSALWEFDLATMKTGKQIFSTPGYDISWPVVDPARSTLLGVEVTENRSTTRWTDPVMAALQKKLSGMVQGAQVEITSFSTDRSVVIAKVGDASAPGAYFIYKAADDSLEPLAMNNSTLKLRRLHPVKTIRYKARDGLEIAAVLTLPRGSGGKKLPLILMPHGGPSARDEENWDWWSQFLADRGYAVIQPNYRGSTGYGTTFLRKAEGQWGLAMQDDLNDAVTALADQGIADPKRVCVVGGSYGGYAAMRAAQRDGALFRCAVSFAGVSDLGRMVAYDSQFLGGGAGKDWMKEQAPDFKAVSPLFHAEEFSTPVLLVHGKKDRRVPFKQSKLMADRLRAAGKPFEFIEQPEGDHHFTRGEDRLSFLQALEAFLAKYNPA